VSRALLAEDYVTHWSFTIGWARLVPPTPTQLPVLLFAQTTRKSTPSPSFPFNTEFLLILVTEISLSRMAVALAAILEYQFCARSKSVLAIKAVARW